MALSHITKLMNELGKDNSNSTEGIRMGKALLQQITESTGLPENLIENELQTLISAAGVHSESVTLDDLRKILAEYMQEVLLAAKEDLAG